MFLNDLFTFFDMNFSIREEHLPHRAEHIPGGALGYLQNLSPTTYHLMNTCYTIAISEVFVANFRPCQLAATLVTVRNLGVLKINPPPFPFNLQQDC